MKNNFFYLFIFSFIFYNLNLIAKELEVNSYKVKYDNINQITIFEGDVNSLDEQGNRLFSDFAKFNKAIGLFETKGKTKIITSEGYVLLGSDIFLDNEKKIIYSNKKAQIKDMDGNIVLVEMFNYSILTNIFFSKGKINVSDINNNNYNFSEIYIDEKKKKIIGSDLKALLDPKNISLNDKNEPRFYANTMTLTKDLNTLDKGIFTYCKTRDGEKCPPWALRSKKINHDLAKKTIYYEDVVLKIYDFPIFYSPRFSHADPTVSRRSGLLAPSLTNSTNVGSGFSVPYFWNIANDKDLTFTPKLFINEKPLMLAEYRQDFINSFLIVDAGYTQGYKKKNNKKTSGGRAHFFSNFNMSLIDEDETNSSFELNVEKVSNDTYLKVYDIRSSLADKDINVLENTAQYKYQNKDFYFGVTPSVFEDINKVGHKRYEYLLPLNIEKNIASSEKYGLLDIDSHIKIRNYETNKKTEFFVNNFNWKSNKWLNKFGVENYFEGLLKTVNYNADKTETFKNKKGNSELNSAVGYFAKLGMYKKDIINERFHTLVPKFLLRYAPGHMRNINDGAKLSYANLFSLNKVDELDVIESGLSSSLGFEYKKNKLSGKKIIGEEIFSFAVGQVISEKENTDIPSQLSLDQRFSDIVGQSKYTINNKMKLNYNFSIDQSYKNFNYNEVGTDLYFKEAKFNLNYLQEKNHVGNQEFIKSGVNYNFND